MTVRLREAETVSEETAWPDAPIPFDSELVGPELPSGAFPAPLETFIQESSESSQIPLGMAAAAVLSTVATAAARRARVAIGSTHSEQLNLYVGCVAAPGERKSYALRAALAPLERGERELREQQAESVAENHQRRAVAEGRVRHLQAQAAKADDRDEREALIREAAELERDTPDERAEPRLVLDDATPEALVRSLAEQGGKIALISEEGGTLIGVSSGRYDRTGAPNVDALLKAYDGGMIRVSRIGRPAVTVTDPALTIGVMLQPALLDRIGEVSELRGRGLLARFAWVWPGSLVGTRRYQDRAVSAATSAAYGRIVARLLELSAPEDASEAMPLRLEGDALALWAAYADMLERAQADGGRLAGVRDWASKHAGRVARIAGLWHLVRHVGGTIPASIESAEVESAVRVGEWLTGHALAVFARIGADPAVAECKRILSWIRDGKRDQFTRRELHQARYRNRLRPEELDPYLGALESRGFILRLPNADRPAGGRPSAAYAVHPDLRTQAQNPQNTRKLRPKSSSEGFEPFEYEDCAAAGVQA